MKHADAREHFLGGAAAPAGLGEAAGRGAYERFGKRALDLALAVLLAPSVGLVIAVLCAVVFAADRHAPLFGHRRVGRGGVPFTCWKIRTMAPDAEARLEEILARDPDSAAEWRANHKLSHDPRITRIGEFLRRTSLDELPQLWNVLRGEMSFVGPRPVTEPELEKYGAARAAYCAVRPGITGLWQVSGRNSLSYEERVALDARYARGVGLGRDLRILLGTAGVVFHPTGI